MKKSLLIACSIAALSYTSPAFAQRFELQGIYQRLNRLESDMGLMQRQGGGAGAPAAAGNTGQLSADIMRMDEENRALRGELERLSYQNEQTLKQVQKLQEDLEYRMQEMEKSASAAAMAPAMDDAAVMDPTSQSAPAAAQREDLTEDLTAVVRGQEASAAESTITPVPGNARDLYNSAFKQLNQTNYTGAVQSFQSFTQKYPNDPLAGNAWYWLGEAYYVQRDYMKAADSFRQGYAKLPTGPKAGDNLLKLGMSLAAMNQSKEACVVMQQVDKKFSATSESIKSKARQEISRLGCK